MARKLSLTAGLLCLAVTLPAVAAELMEKKSRHGAAETMDRLEAAVKDAGATIVARLDHSGAAAKAGMELAPTMLLIFGNPKLGTPLMQSSQTAGLDLPLKMLVYQDAQGAVRIAYEDPKRIAKRHGIKDRGEVIERMQKALAKFAETAAN